MSRILLPLLRAALAALLCASSTNCILTLRELDETVLNHALGLTQEKSDTQTRDAMLLALIASSGPEINIRVGSVNYPSGSSYDFTGSASGQITFTIQNLGRSNLSIYGASITNTGNYSMTQPLSNAVAPFASTTFTAGNWNGAGGTALITILSNDSDEGTYTITGLPCNC